MNSPQPDLRVGVDFGTTYTGISWNAPNEKRHETNIIKQWPGHSKLENKVPTVLAKDASGGETGWGFLCKNLAEDKKWKLFKLLLDPEVYQKRSTSNGHEPWTPRTMDQVYELVVLYLRQIYIHISNKIPELIKIKSSFSPELKLKTWDSMKIDFIFSTPTTWEAPVSQCFKGLVSKAGFGEQKRHRVMLGLTEAEAAAVFTCQLETVCKIRKHDIVLSIDAGGGTTDLAFVKATANTTDSLTLEGIHPVTGVGVGSTSIDSEFTKLIQGRINKNPKARSELPRDFSLKASQSHGFQTWKHKLGSKNWDYSSNECFTKVAEAKEYNNEALQIYEGCLYFTRAELEGCFNITLQEIKGLIKRALGNFEAKNRSKGISRQVDYIVLSGGLGSSKYVLKELNTYFNSLTNEANSCVAVSSVLGAEGDARTVVAKGLLYDRGAKARALGEHIARANYGIIVEKPLSRGSAASKNIKQYPANATTFVRDQIHWLVEHEDTIKVGKPITIDITKHLEKSDQRKWTEEIVWLSGKRDLPEYRKDGESRGMKVLHKVDIEVRPGTKLKNARKWWGPTAYHECHFTLTLVVGPSSNCVVEVSENVIVRSK